MKIFFTKIIKYIALTMVAGTVLLASGCADKKAVKAYEAVTEQVQTNPTKDALKETPKAAAIDVAKAQAADVKPVAVKEEEATTQLNKEEADATPKAETVTEDVKATVKEVATEAVKTEDATKAPAKEDLSEKATKQEVKEATDEKKQTEEGATSVELYRDVVVTDDFGDVSKYESLTEARTNLTVKTLSETEAKAAGLQNKVAYSDMAAQVLQLINEYRREKGINTVAYSEVLTETANIRAVESAYADWNVTATEIATGAKRHIRPNFEKASSIAQEYNLTGSFGENYGRFQESAKEIVTDWINSKSHRAILEKAEYTSCGIGIAADAEGNLYFIAHFN